MADKEFTYSDVSEHNTKKDLFIVVHDKVYNASSFVDEHPYVRSLITLSHSTRRGYSESRLLCSSNDEMGNLLTGILQRR
jgi:hypothetical protein